MNLAIAFRLKLFNLNLKQFKFGAEVISSGRMFQTDITLLKKDPCHCEVLKLSFEVIFNLLPRSVYGKFLSRKKSSNFRFVSPLIILKRKIKSNMTRLYSRVFKFSLYKRS